MLEKLTFKRVYSKIWLYEENKRQTKLYTVVRKDVKLQHQQALKYIILCPLHKQTPNK